MRRVHSASGRKARPSRREAADESQFASRLDCNIARNPGDRAVDISSSAGSERIDGHPAKAYQGHNGYGSLSLLLSRVAKSKVTHPMLKQFVDFEIAEQETVADALKAIQTNAAPSGSIPSPSDTDLLKNLDDAGKASVEKLRALKAGSEFDRDYIRYEVEGHRKLLDIQEVYLKAPDNLDQTNVAKLAQGMIKEHLTLLADLDKAA